MPLLLFDGMLSDEIVHQLGCGGYHSHAGTGGVVLFRSGEGIGVGGGICQDLPADNTAVLRLKCLGQLLHLLVGLLFGFVVCGFIISANCEKNMYA